MGDDNFRDALPDPDPEQTLEWQEAIRAVSDALGPERAHRLLMQTIGAAREEGIDIDVVNTPYLNTIHPSPTKFLNISVNRKLAKSSQV